MRLSTDRYDPDGMATRYSFEYGITSNYDTKTSTVALPASSGTLQAQERT